MENVNNQTFNMKQNVTTVQTPSTVVVHIESDKAPFLNDDAFYILQLVFYVVLGILFGMFGTVANIINIIVFMKQGLFSGGGTINLFFLAIADFGVVFFNFLTGVASAIVLGNIRGLNVDPYGIVYLGTAWPHAICVTINRMLTAYVAFERCMCVVIPFRVKSIFKPERSLVYLLTFFAYGILSHIPIYLTHELRFVAQEGSNVSKLVLTFGNNRKFWYDFVSYCNYYVLCFLCVGTVLTCTVITSTYVMTSKEWRQSATSSKQADHIKTAPTLDMTSHKSNSKDGTSIPQKIVRVTVDKEARLVKMITIISIIFCICYIPEFVILIAMHVDERINTGGQYQRLLHILFGFKFLPATINSSINIFVYYRMSSKYKQVFLSWCGKRKSNP